MFPIPQFRSNLSFRYNCAIIISQGWCDSAHDNFKGFSLNGEYITFLLFPHWVWNTWGELVCYHASRCPCFIRSSPLVKMSICYFCSSISTVAETIFLLPRNTQHKNMLKKYILYFPRCLVSYLLWCYQRQHYSSLECTSCFYWTDCHGHICH